MPDEATSDYSPITTLVGSHLLDLAQAGVTNFKMTVTNFVAGVLSSAQPNRTISTSDTTDNTDRIVFIDASGATLSVTLSNSTKTAGKKFEFQRIDNSIVNKVILVPESGNINGLSSLNMPNPYQRGVITTDGTNWFFS